MVEVIQPASYHTLVPDGSGGGAGVRPVVLPGASAASAAPGNLRKWSQLFGDGSRLRGSGTAGARQPPPKPMWSSSSAAGGASGVRRGQGFPKYRGGASAFSNDPHYDVPLRERIVYHKRNPISDDTVPRPVPFPGQACARCLLNQSDAVSLKSDGSGSGTDVTKLGLKNIFLVHTETQVVSKGGIISRYACYLSFAFGHPTRYDYPDVSRDVLDSKRVKEAIRRKANLDARLMPGSSSESSVSSSGGDDDSDDSTPPPSITLPAAASATSIAATTRQHHSTATRRAQHLINVMRANISHTMLNMVGYTLYRVLPRFISSIQVDSGQLALVREASTNRSHRPLVFLPLHHSHLDYILLTFTLWAHNIRAPHIAAGDNLNITLFGWLSKCLGGFFIKRKMDAATCHNEKDYVYRAVLHQYMLEILRNGQYLEFFIEGGRSRSGKANSPKAGLLSVVMDAISSDKSLHDVYLVPVSINYERLPDGNFVSEQLGEVKQKETFFKAIRSMWKLINSNYGNIRISFGQPYSLQSVMQSLEQHDRHSKRHIRSGGLPHHNASTTSLYGTDVTHMMSDRRDLVKHVAEHVLHGSVEVSVCMSTNIIAFLLLTRYRQGCSLQQLTHSLEELRQDDVWRRKQRRLGFSGRGEDVLRHALRLLLDTTSSMLTVTSQTSNNTTEEVRATGQEVRAANKEEEEMFIKPAVESVSGVLELAYYAASVQTVFAMDSIVVISLCKLMGLSLNDTHVDTVNSNTHSGTVNSNTHSGTVTSNMRSDTVTSKTYGYYEAVRSDVSQLAAEYAQMMQYEFCLCKPCESHDTVITSSIDALVGSDLVRVVSDSSSVSAAAVIRSQSQSQSQHGVTAVRCGPDMDEDDEINSDDEMMMYSDDDSYSDVEHDGQYKEKPPPVLKLQIDRPCTRDIIERFQWSVRVLGAYLETYWVAANSLTLLVDNDVPESTYLKHVLTECKKRVETGQAVYVESVSLDSIKNALKLFTSRDVVTWYYPVHSTHSTQGTSNIKMLHLADEYARCGQEMLYSQYIDKLDAFTMVTTAADTGPNGGHTQK